MNRTEQSVLDFISRNKLLSEDDKILVALSGGADSVFLLNFLLKFRRKLKIEIAAYHLNHLIRKKAAFDDEQFCSEFCSKQDIPFFLERVDVRAVAKRDKISVEEAGRNTRYLSLEKISEEKDFNKIATGHNINDNTETVLLNLFKGTGIRGISGIPIIRGKIIRPILSISKEEIKEYLTEAGIPYRTDRSNLIDSHERNFLRNQIIPRIRGKINPSLDETIFRSSRVFRNISNYIEKKTAEALPGLLEEDENVKIRIDKLKETEPELLQDLIKTIIERNFLIQLSFNDTLAVVSLFEKTTGKGVNIPGKIRAVREREHLIIYNVKQHFSTYIEIMTGDHCRINEKTLFIQKWSESVVLTGNKNEEFISGDNLGDSFIIREWKDGDRFIPFGMNGSMLVSDFLNSLKIPSFEKKEKLVLTNEKDIIWVIGHRINDKFKIKPETQRVLKLCLK
jgi:tRNA(Ile)-lysidine synthase